MKTHPRHFPLLGFTLLCLAASAANGATSLTNSLTGFTGNSEDGSGANQPPTLGGSGLNVSFIWPDGDTAWEKIDFGATGATFGNHQGGANGRNYLRTNETDYATVGFTAYVTVDRPTRQSVYFGMGTATLGEFKQPDVNSGNASVFLDLQEGFDNASRRILGGSSGTPTNVESGYTPMTTITGPMRLRMVYDAVAATVTYTIDYGPSGAFVADTSDFVVDVSSITAEWAGGESSSIYFGGQQGVTFSDFSVTVVPEPSTAMLLLGFSALAFRRRRRN